MLESPALHVTAYHAYTRWISDFPNESTVALNRLAGPQNLHTAGSDAGGSCNLTPTGVRSPRGVKDRTDVGAIGLDELVAIQALKP